MGTGPVRRWARRPQLRGLLRDRFRDDGIDVEVRAESFAALNGRPSRRFLDPTVDLAAIDDGLAPYGFVLPFTSSADR